MREVVQDDRAFPQGIEGRVIAATLVRGATWGLTIRNAVMLSPRCGLAVVGADFVQENGRHKISRIYRGQNRRGASVNLVPRK